MSHYKFLIRLSILPLLLLTTVKSLHAQDIQRPQPYFFVGAAGGANFNFYTGTTQQFNSTLTAPSAFHKGSGIGGYGAVLVEFRPHPVWGFMLNVGYNGRGGTFDEVMAPCNCPASLKAKVGYVTVEPSLRIAPFSSAFYVFIGGTYNYSVRNSFVYTQELKADRKEQFSHIHQHVFAGQVGAGYDIPLSSIANTTQFILSPFISYHPYFGQDPRTIESWSLSTLRVGAALKFGKAPVLTVDVTPPVTAGGLQFSIVAPLAIAGNRRVKETFPLRNYIFFDENSTEIPNRYVKLKESEAADFKEAQFQEPAPKDSAGRSQRQLNVYYTILNIVGDRMRKNPSTSIVLIGASAGKGEEIGKAEAEAVKRYLVTVFEIKETRIETEGRDQPITPSEQPGGKKELDLLRAGDRRVDIVSSSDLLLAPLQISSIQETPLDDRILFKTQSGPTESVKSWSLQVIDEKKAVRNYGPFTKKETYISGNTILGDRSEGNYKIIMLAQTEEGKFISKESKLHLVRKGTQKEEALRFSILFDFNQSETVAAYEKFLTNVVTPLVPDNATVLIHGHSDQIGDDAHNLTLSMDRAQEAKRILETSLIKSGKKGIRYETYGFGSDPTVSPFENKLPEEHFYNRTVIIDIIPAL